MATRRGRTTSRVSAIVLAFTAALGWGGCTTIESIFSRPPAPKATVPPPAKKEPPAPPPIATQPTPLPPAQKPPEPVQPAKKAPEAPPDQKEPPPLTKVPAPPPPPPPAKTQPAAPPPAQKPPESVQPAKKEPETPPVQKEPEIPPPVLVPQVGKGGEEHLKRTASLRIQTTEQLIVQLDGKKLTSEQQEQLLTVQSLLANAKEALGTPDLTKASTLADKARILAEELTKTVR